MSSYEREYFQKFKFASAQIDRYVQGAVRDLEIARKTSSSKCSLLIVIRH